MPKDERHTCTIEIRQADGVAIVDVRGPLFLGEGSATLTEKIKELLNQGHKNLAVNLGGASKIDSSGMGALVHAHSSVRNAGGKLRVFAVTPQVSQILKMVRLETVFEIYPDEAAALASFQ